MRHQVHFKRLATAALFLVLSAPAYAAGDGDTDSSKPGGFVDSVNQSTALILRVPVNQQGEELTNAAELHLHTGPALTTAGDFRSSFDQDMDITTQPQITPADISKDSSTRGWFGGGRGGGRGGWGGGSAWGGFRGGNGWANNYYSYYQPSYYQGGSYWNYGSPYYQNYYGYYPSYGSNWGAGYYGYRYYYYPRY